MKLAMAMIVCPECGKEISDKAKKCVYCGKVFIEEIQPKKFCTECGREISVDTQECPYCGCPVEKEKTESALLSRISEKTKKNKKPIIIIAIVAVVILAIGLVVKFAGSTLNEDEQLAYQNAVKLKSMMRDPDSFKLYDEMFLLKRFDDDGSVKYTYTVFKYGGANGYGAITTDEAIFKDGNYVMDYADEADEDDSNYFDQLLAKLDLSIWAITGDGDKFQMVEINIEKIKNKMGLK